VTSEGGKKAVLKLLLEMSYALLSKEKNQFKSPLENGKKTEGIWKSAYCLLLAEEH